MSGRAIPIAFATVTVLTVSLIAGSIYLAPRTFVSPGLERSGPTSTFPAAWIDVCGFPVHGNTSTFNGIVSSFMVGVPKFTLAQVYTSIVSSQSFRQASAGKGWVTASWNTFEISGPKGTSSIVQGLFVLISGGQPSGFVRANYDLGTGNVTADDEASLFSSCPARAESSVRGSIDRPSPAYYPLGVPIMITFVVSDYTTPDLVVSSHTSCLASFVVRVSNTEGPVVYNSTRHQSCAGPPLQLVLHPGQNYSEGMSWNQTDDNGKQVPNGVYEVMGSEAGNNSLGFNGPVGRVYFGTPVPVTPQEFIHNFYFNLNTPQAFYSRGQSVTINEGLSNNGQTIAEIQTGSCSFGYQIFNLTGSLVYDSTRHQSCNGPPVDNSLAPEGGGIEQMAVWHQVDDSGKQVGLGLYHIVETIRVASAGQAINTTQRWDLVIGSSSAQPEMIGISSSSICASSCGGPGPSLSAVVDVNGNLESLTLYLNGVRVVTRTYGNLCDQMTCEISFSTPIDSRFVPVYPGGSYDIVFVGTFHDGNSSISWAVPLLPRH